MSGLEVIQVIASVSELARMSLRIYQFIDRLSKADANARETHKRIKHLHEVVNGAELALQSRKEQVEEREVMLKEKAVWGYIETSSQRSHSILLRIRSVYTSYGVETQPGIFERAIRQVKLEFIKKEDLAELYSALSYQIQALTVNTQSLNTFISIGTSDKVDNSREEIIKAIDKLSVLYRKGNTRLGLLLDSRDQQALSRPRGLSIGFSSASAMHDQDEGPEDVKTMQGTLDAAKDLITIYDPTNESIADRMEAMHPEDLDSGFGSDDDGDDAQLLEQKSDDRPPPRDFKAANVQHLHTKSKRVLDSCIEKYQSRVEVALEKNQVQTAEADLRQLMEYAQERKEKYDIPFDRIQMQEQLALVYKKQAKNKEAIDVLSDLLPEKGTATDPTLDNSRHFQMVAEIYYELWTSTDTGYNLKEAHQHVLTAFTIRDQQTELDENLVSESAKLLANVYEGMNRPVEAEVYRDMVLHTHLPDGPPLTPRLDDLSLVESETITELDEEIDINKELEPTIKAGNIPKLRALLQRENIDLEQTGRHSWTPLMYAFKYAKSDTMPLALIERGFAIDATDDDWRHVLHQAAARADPAMIRLAIHRDAAKEAKDKNALTPLLVAVKEGYRHRECKAAIEALLDEHCDPKAKDKDGWTALHHAAHNSASNHMLGGRVLEVLEYLLDRLPSTVIETKDKEGYSPLHRIANSGDATTISILLSHHADANTRNNAGRSPLYLAMYKKPDTAKYTDVIKLLVEAGATVYEYEHSKEDFARFKDLLGNKEDARKPSEHSRRFSKDSFHHVERAGSVATMSSDGTTEKEAKPKKTRRWTGSGKLWSS